MANSRILLLQQVHLYIQAGYILQGFYITRLHFNRIMVDIRE